MNGEVACVLWARAQSCGGSERGFAFIDVKLTGTSIN